MSLNEYIRVVRHTFALAVDSKAIADSPAALFKLHRPEQPIRNTPTREQFEALVSHIRANRFSEHAEDTAELVEFMGLAGFVHLFGSRQLVPKETGGEFTVSRL